MQKAILAKKLGMTQVFSETGEFIPVTVLQAEPNVVVQKKTIENDGYEAIKVGFLEKTKNVIKPQKGQFEKAGVTPKRILKEFRLEDISSYEVGAEIKVDIFASGDKVDATGVSKGKGTQGPIKRHGQSRGPMSHGSKYHRGGGSMGAATSPGRVFKGKKLAGHMGSKQVTVQNLEIVRTELENNLILVKGNVPGPKNAVVLIKNSVKA